MIYLIGGGARCGKSMLAKRLLKALPNAAYLSGDSFRQALKPVLPVFHTSGVNADDPKAYIQYYTEHTDEAIDETVRRAEVIWPFMERYIHAYSHERKDDLIVESVDVWPQYVDQLSVPHKAVFLVDSNSTQWQRVTEHLGQNDWITNKHLTQDQIEAWALYNAPRSKRVMQTAKQYGYDFFDIAELGFVEAQAESLQSIL